MDHKNAGQSKPIFESLSDVKQEVENRQGVLTIPMEAVRVAYGARRLGSQVRENISKELKGLGLGHYPVDLPVYYHEVVRIYKLGSPVADLIDAVLTPSEAHDSEIREAVQSEATTVLNQIREWVCK